MNSQVSSQASTARGIALTVVTAGVAGALVNALISLAAQGLGVDATVTMGL